MIEFINNIYRYMAGLSDNLEALFAQAGYIPYLILWINMFLETGGIFFAFLPSNSVLLATAAFAAGSGRVRIETLVILFFTSTFLGDFSSFMIGRFIGRKYKKNKGWIRFINQDQFDAAHDYFQTNGRKTFIASRFIPVFRGLMPLVAGFTQISYRKILPYSLLGVALWNGTYLSLGYFFGNIPSIKDNFPLIILIIIFVTMIPTLYVFWRNYKKFKANFANKNTISKPANGSISPDPSSNDPSSNDPSSNDPSSNNPSSNNPSNINPFNDEPPNDDHSSPD